MSNLPNPDVRDFTVQICDDCLNLRGEMCHEPECRFCWRTMAEVAEYLNVLLIRPIIDGVGVVVDDGTPQPSPEPSETTDPLDCSKVGCLRQELMARLTRERQQRQPEKEQLEDMLKQIAAVASKAEAAYLAVEEAVRRVCPPTEEPDDPRYACFTEDADLIVEADTLAEAVRQIIASWIAVCDERQQHQPGTCAWRQDMSGAWTNACASASIPQAFHQRVNDMWMFCPYCGKTITLPEAPQ